MKRPLWTTAQTAYALGVHPHTVHRYVKEQGLPVIRVGRTWRFDRDAVREWVRARHAADREVTRPARRAARPPAG